jgi:hypothetical protein
MDDDIRKENQPKNINPINILNLWICDLDHKIGSTLYEKTMKLNPDEMKHWRTKLETNYTKYRFKIKNRN